MDDREFGKLTKLMADSGVNLQVLRGLSSEEKARVQEGAGRRSGASLELRQIAPDAPDRRILSIFVVCVSVVCEPHPHDVSCRWKPERIEYVVDPKTVQTEEDRAWLIERLIMMARAAWRTEMPRPVQPDV